MRANLKESAAGRWSGDAVALAALLVILMSAGFWGAASAEALDEEAQEGGWLFTPGRVEAGGYVGGGFSFEGGPWSATSVLLLPRVGYVLVEQDRFLPGRFENFFLLGFSHFL